MKIYFCTYSHNNTGLSGSNVYHHNLAKVFLSWGWEVRSLNLHIPSAMDCEGVWVCPLSLNEANQNWCDVIITHPGPHIFAKAKKRRVIIKHNDQPEPHGFEKDKILYCGGHVATVARMGCVGSFIWNPGNRFYGTEKRGNPSGPWIMVNCNENKGGRRLIELAEEMPDTQFAGILGAYGPQIKNPLPNLEYWRSAPEIGQYFEKAAGLLCLSKDEGFPTGVMEAMSHGLPVVGNSSCGGLRDVCGNAGFLADGSYGWGSGIELMEGEFRNKTIEAGFARVKEIEERRDFAGLKTFFEG